MTRVLLVHARSGAPPEYAIPKVAGTADTQILVVTPLSATAKTVAEEHCESIIDVSDRRLCSKELVDCIVEVAEESKAEAVLTFSEFGIISVAEACRRLGFRGPGSNIQRARSKRLMRHVWASAGVPTPTWRPVDSFSDLRAAWDQLAPPILLKSAWSAAAVGQVMIRSLGDLESAWNNARAALADGARTWFAELQGEAGTEFLADEIISSTTRSWYTDDRYGDHVSVEGLVVDGCYYPVCITSKAPTTPPFTERANFTPCVLEPALQKRIETTARAAVDALGLETCATHTEIKLMDSQGLCLLETAARFAGVLVTREVETVHGVDMIGCLVRALLGQDPQLPREMMIAPSAPAAGSVALYAADSKGRPWASLPIFDADRIDWSALVTPGTRVEIFKGLTRPAGSLMPPYDLSNGYLSAAGLVFLTSPSPAVLLSDAHSIMDRLEYALA